MKNQHKKINRGRGKFIINIYNTPQEEKEVENKTEVVTKTIVLPWYRRLFSWLLGLIMLFLKWLWSHPKKLFASALAGLMVWLASFFPFKLPTLPFLPKVPVVEKQKEEKPKDNKKSDEQQKQETPVNNNNPTNSVAGNTNKTVSTQYVTNTVTQTNVVSQTNYVTETKYVTNYVIQPIVVTNTVYKEVPITVTNVLVIKNNVGNSDTNSNNKNSVISGPAFYFTDDFNTLLQNQQQNPVKSKPLN